MKVMVVVENLRFKLLPHPPKYINMYTVNDWLLLQGTNTNIFPGIWNKFQQKMSKVEIKTKNTRQNKNSPDKVSVI